MQKLEHEPLRLKYGAGEVTLRRPIKRIPVEPPVEPHNDIYEVPVNSPYMDMSGSVVNVSFHI